MQLTACGSFCLRWIGVLGFALTPAAVAADEPTSMPPLAQQSAVSGTWLLLAAGLIVMLALGLTGAWVSRKSRSRRQSLRAGPGEDSGARGYPALFENANELILEVQLDGQFVYTNSAWQELLDLNPEDLAALSIFNVVHSESLNLFRYHFQQAVKGVKVKQLEATLISKHGRKLVVEGSLHRELDGDRPVAIQGIFRDITERQRSQLALKRSQERFSRVFATSPIAIGVVSIAQGRFQDVNESFLRMLGYEREEVIGRTDLDLGIWPQPGDRQRLLEEAQDHSVRDSQCQLRTKTGGVRQALISAEIIEIDIEKSFLQAVEISSERCLLLMIHDNTDRLNLETQLRQAQKMEGFGQLAAGIAHDFNNVITVIQGHAARLRNADGDSESMGQSIEHISAAADRSATLTRQLLTFCRKQSIAPKVLAMNEVVTQISKLLERVLGAHVALNLKLGGDLPNIHADSGMIEQIIMNLTCNARDAMPKGGRLTISTSQARIMPADLPRRPKARPGVHVCLSVTDTGSGMSPETLRRIFEPFFTTKDVGKGTGLGLATVHGIVDQHRGWIEVASVPGKGTTFSVYLPATDKAAASSEAPSASPPKRKGTETILLVEDEEPLRELARLVLEDQGYRIFEADSGVQGLKVWEEHKESIDMLLTDMVMPEGLTGRDLAERLQLERPDLKVLYSSGYSPDVVGGNFSLPNNSRFLAKPYQPPELARVVRECLDQTAAPCSGMQEARLAA